MGLELFWASDDTPTQGAARWVLKQLGTMAKDATGWCWVRIGKLAEMVGVSERQVQRVLKRLEALGLIEVRRGNGAGRVSRFLVVLEPGGKRVTSPCGQPGDAAAERVTSCPKKGDTMSPRKEVEKKEAVAPKQPVDKSPSWARGFSHLNAFFATSSCASSAPATPCRPGGSPMPGLPPFTPPARSTTTSAGSSSATSSARSGPQGASGSVADLVAGFLAERQGTPGARPRW
jgi:DNA-binding transcriptional MocR family regulator